MNAFKSLARACREEQIDHRSDEQILRDAVKDHLVNVDRLNAVSAGSASELIFRAAEKAYENSQAELFRLIEDQLLINPLDLGRALNA